MKEETRYSSFFELPVGLKNQCFVFVCLQKRLIDMFYICVSVSWIVFSWLQRNAFYVQQEFHLGQ